MMMGEHPRSRIAENAMGFWFDWDAMQWVDKRVRPEGALMMRPSPLSPLMQKVTGATTMGEFVKQAYAATEVPRSERSTRPHRSHMS
jgi:hypothetical protein